MRYYESHTNILYNLSYNMTYILVDIRCNMILSLRLLAAPLILKQNKWSRVQNLSIYTLFDVLLNIEKN